jgi:hypothetical protein
MAAGDVTVANFTAGDAVAAKAAIESLGFATTDLVSTWQQNNMVFVARIEIN